MAAPRTALSLGGQVEVLDKIFVGAAFGFGASETSRSATTLDTVRGRAGLTVKYVDNGLSLGGVIAGSLGQTEWSRPNATGTATEEIRVETVSALMRGAYTISGPGCFITPELSGGVTIVSGDGYSETRAGINNSMVGGFEDTSLSVQPCGNGGQ